MKKLITIGILILMISLVGCNTKLYEVDKDVIKDNLSCSEFCKEGKDLGNNVYPKDGQIECGRCVCYSDFLDNCNKC